MLAESDSSRSIVLAITGASGAVYAVRLLEVLVESGHHVHLVISPSGAAVIKQELNRDIPADRFDARLLLPSSASEKAAQLVRQHHHADFMSPLASGSFVTGGMVVCPCSGSTLSGIAHGASNNLIHRAAEVHLKEYRKLILVPREAPLSLVQLDNMRRAAEAGAVILPASPGWYHGVESVRDLIDFIVARILDQLGVPHTLMKRWGDS